MTTEKHKTKTCFSDNKVAQELLEILFLIVKTGKTGHEIDWQEARCWTDMCCCFSVSQSGTVNGWLTVETQRSERSRWRWATWPWPVNVALLLCFRRWTFLLHVKRETFPPSHRLLCSCSHRDPNQPPVMSRHGRGRTALWDEQM